jgi:hypothetical protein
MTRTIVLWWCHQTTKRERDYEADSLAGAGVVIVAVVGVCLIALPGEAATAVRHSKGGGGLKVGRTVTAASNIVVPSNDAGGFLASYGPLIRPRARQRRSTSMNPALTF